MDATTRAVRIYFPWEENGDSVSLNAANLIPGLINDTGWWLSFVDVKVSSHQKASSPSRRLVTRPLRRTAQTVYWLILCF